MSHAPDDDLDAGRAGRGERVRAAYAEHRLDLLRLAVLLGADETAADDAVDAAFLAYARRWRVRDPERFLHDRVLRRVAATPEHRTEVLRFRSGDLGTPSGRALAARSRAVVAGPPRLEAALRRRTMRRRRVLAAVAVLAVVVTGTVVGVRAAGRPHHPVAVGSGPLAPAVDVREPAVGSVPLARYGLAVLADPGVEVLDATDGHTALLSSAARGATALGLSRDGRYVAALIDPDTVEVLDQHDAVVWTGDGDIAAWSPTSDVLAVDGTSALRLVTPGQPGAGAYGGIPPTGSPVGLAWRPDGTALAVGTASGLTVLGIGLGFPGGTVAAPAGTALDPVTWTADGTHLLVFDEPDGTALNTYGVRVLSAAFTGGRLSLGRQLGATVPQPGWWSADGRGAVLGVLGTGHGAVEQQRVVRCDLTAGTCATLAAGGDVDPVATASGVAYLAADGTVVLAAADGSDARPAPGAPAAAQLLADGDVLLIAGRDAIYRYSAGTRVLLTATDTGGAAGQDTEIVSWQPNARSST